MPKTKTRKKPDAVYVIRDWAEADEGLRAVALHERRIGQINAILDAKIDALRTQAAEQIEPHASHIRSTEDALQHFVASKIKELEDKDGRRSRELNHGAVGFRKTPPAVRGIPRDRGKLAELIANLRRRRLHECIAVEEKVLKSRLAELDDGRLSALGLRRVQDDEFYYELREDGVIDS